MKLIFLGTSASFPTKDRNHTAVLLRYGAEALLFDCGEGTQRQIRIAKESPMKITKIFITHWHGDHVLGLGGLLQSSSMNNRKEPMEIYGPKDTRTRMDHLLKTCEFVPSFEIKIKEIDTDEPKVICEGDGYFVKAVNGEHKIPCLSFAFEENPRYKINKDFVDSNRLQGNPGLNDLQRGKDITINGKKIKAKDVTYEVKGKKVSYVVDTVPTKGIAELATESDILISEATFLNEIKEKSTEHGHMTAKTAGKLAKGAKAKQLIITHFSQRYKTTKELLDEARRSFKNTIAASDFMEITV